MAMLHIQVNAPKYDDKLPAYCYTKMHNKKEMTILWGSYIDPRSNQVVYLSSIEGRYLMVPESLIEDNTVESMNGSKEGSCQQRA